MLAPTRELGHQLLAVPPPHPLALCGRQRLLSKHHLPSEGLPRLTQAGRQVAKALSKHARFSSLGAFGGSSMAQQAKRLNQVCVCV